MSAILTSGQPPGMRTKKGGGIGFMYDSPAPNNHVAIFGGASANNSDGSAKKDYPGGRDVNDFNGHHSSNGDASSSSTMGPDDGDITCHNWRAFFEADLVSYVTEDVRLSTLQKKLVKEPNATTALALAFQISASILLNDNRHYVRRLTDVISEAIVEVFYGKHADAVKEESANALGKVGFILADHSAEFDKWYKWLWTDFEESKKENAQNLYLRSLAAMLRLKPRFGDHVVHMVMKDMQELLERTESSTLILTLVDSLVIISEWKPKLFEPIFQDVVDILVGWHIDSMQTPSVRSHMSEVLLSWNSYWIIDMEFSSSLLKQFMEDLDAFEKEVDSGCDKAAEIRDVSERTLSLMQVFNTVLSCLKTQKQEKAVSFLPPDAKIWCGNILDCLSKLLKKLFDEDILVVGQHSLILLLERIDTLFGMHNPKIMSYIEASCDNFSKLTFSGQVVALGFLGRMFQFADAKSKQQIVRNLMGPNSAVVRASFCQDRRVFAAGVDLYKALLNSKDILVLQEVYGQLTALFEEALVGLSKLRRFRENRSANANNAFADLCIGVEERRRVCHFVLACIADMAMAKGSVLSMWALDPPIFRLLSDHAGVADEHFAEREPWVHHAILKLLHDHSACHAHFLSSSDLVVGAGNFGASPSSTFFSAVLVSLRHLVGMGRLWVPSQKLTLEWSREVLSETLKSGLSLFDKPEFKSLVGALFAEAGFVVSTANKDVVVSALRIVHFVLKEFSLDGFYSCYDSAHNLAQMHARSSDETVRGLSRDILNCLPPLLADWKDSSRASSTREAFEQMKKSVLHQKDERKHSITAPDFRVFVEAILQMCSKGGPEAFRDKTNRQLEVSFLRHEDGRRRSKESTAAQQYLDSLTAYEELKTLHMSRCLSQYCVNNKLKSPLGKAQDTLTTIEKVIRNTTVALLEDKTEGVSMPGCQALLVFFECLERAMSNAYDGGAGFTTQPPPAKAVATFFSANRETCAGWVARLRLAVMQLAFYTGDYACVVRNAQETLQRLVAGKRADAPDWEGEFLKVVILTAVAMVRVGSHEALSGMYVWCVENAGRRLPWLKDFVGLVQNKTEWGTASLCKTVKTLAEGSESLKKYDSASISVINRELYLGFLASCDFANYKEWMSQYREVSSSAADKQEDADSIYLRTLAEFSSGTVPDGIKHYKDALPEHVQFTSKSILTSCHMKLLQAAFLFQQSRGSPQLVGSIGGHLESADAQLRLLAKDHLLAGLGEEQDAHILSMVQQELSFLVARAPSRLDLLLTYKKSSHGSRQLQWIKKWGDFFAKNQARSGGAHAQDSPFLAHLNALNLEISKTARKEQNYNLSYRYLFKALIGELVNPGSSESSLNGYVSSLDFNNLLLSADRAACIRQYAKLAFNSGKEENAIRAMCGIANSAGALIFDSAASSAVEPHIFEVSARALHNVATWFRRRPELIDSVYPDAKASRPSGGGVSLAQVLQLERGVLGQVEFLPVVEEASDSDMVVGRILRHAVNQAPLMAKLWLSLASWSSDLGEKVLESCNQNGSSGIVLTEDERQSVLEGLPRATKCQLDEVFDLLQRHRLSQSVDKRVIQKSKQDFMRSELAACPALHDTDDDGAVVDKILAVWSGLQRRTYFYHETAVNAYFQYIALHEGGNGDQLITATLRLLQLTVKHALELQESLQAGLETTPSGKWKPIIPQLFSRLNHPVRAVRNRISDLICRIAEDFPHLIIFPAVVGGASSSLTETDKLYKHLTSAHDAVDDDDDGSSQEDPSAEPEEREREEPREDADADDDNPEMQGAYAQIVDAMVKQCGDAVEQVQRFVNELQRISLLWDELWLGTLQQYSGDITKRIKRMEDEVARLNRNQTLSAEEKKLLVLDKYNIVFKPLLYVFEKVYSITNKEAETPHEAAFHKRFRETIDKTMLKIRKPADPSRPKESWGGFLQLQATLSKRLTTKTALKLGEISPALRAMRDTRIPMPGVTDNREVDVKALEDNLSILLTKTKPKKVCFLGSDGKKYTYLFKGLEDLHLDEKIMQFLKIANVMMRKTGNGSDYHARNYSVVPLGPRSGLIQWVGGAMPVYSILKKRQQRQQQLDPKAAAAAAAFQRPTEAFYNKLYPMLRDKGVAIENRRAWPISVMRQVMQELIGETPDNLLSQELWYASVDSRHWLELTQNITRSIAVMTVIGYIIGLGDRHLDNLLIDFRRGEIIHIDYNICFEKGKRLRIPERVPCRLTQNLVKLFGMSGVEGLFRSACERTLETLRNGKETLMCLLEAFIYDPLVDWTPGVVELGIAGAYHGGRGGGGQDGAVPGDAAQDKRDMQSEITFSMYAVRVAEMKGPWLENRNDLTEHLSALEDKISAWADQRAAADGLTDQLAKMHHSMTFLKEAEANPTHRLYSLHDRYVEHNMIESAVEAARDSLNKFIGENEKWANLHQRAVAMLLPANIAKWQADVASSAAATSPASALVKGFLENAGQSQLLEQFQSVESSFCIGVENLKQTLLACVQLLSHYGNLSALYPQSYRQRHRTAQYVRLAAAMTEEFTVAKSQEVILDFTRRFVDTEADDGRQLKRHHLLNLQYQMDAWATEMNVRLQNIFQRLMSEGIENSGAVMLRITSAKMELLQHNTPDDGGREKVGVLTCSVVERLASIAAGLSRLEAAADAAADGMVDVAEGELPLLDEIRMRLGVAANLLDTLDLVGAVPADCAGAADVVQQMQSVSKQMAQFSSNFYVIVMQEGIKSFQREDPTVIAVAIQLTEILSSAGMSLEDLLMEMDVSISCLWSGVALSNEEMVSTVREMKNSYSRLVAGVSESQSRESLSPGHLLFLAFDSLFNNYERSIRELKAAIVGMGSGGGGSSHWRAGTTKATWAMASTDPEAATLLELSAFLCRLVFLRDFFTICTRSMLSFKADPGVLGEMLPSGDDVARAINKFLAATYARQLCGSASGGLSALVRQFAERALPEGAELADGGGGIEALAKTALQSGATGHLKSQRRFFDLEVESLAGHMRKAELAKYLEQNIEALQANQQITQVQRNSFQWFHEEDLPLEAITVVPPVRLQFLADLKASVGNLAAMLESVTEMQRRYQELNVAVEQRLKWACGANPEVQEVFNSYSTAFVGQAAALKALSAVMKAAGGAAGAVLQHESLRAQSAEAVASDSAFMALMGECQQSASLKETQGQALTPDELRLFALGPQPEDAMSAGETVINSEWIRQKECVISERVAEIKREMRAEGEKVTAASAGIKGSSRALRNCITAHQKLMIDVGTLLRTISKSEDYDIPEISNYLSTYKVFSERVSFVINATMVEEHSDDGLRSVPAALDAVRELSAGIYDDVVGFSNLLKEENVEIYRVKKNRKRELEEGGGGGEKKGRKAGEDAEDDDDGGGGDQLNRNPMEEKNEFAMNVLRRVRLKLEGREPDALKRSSVAKQVDFIIREATSVDNLALMYEGWTAWI